MSGDEKRESTQPEPVFTEITDPQKLQEKIDKYIGGPKCMVLQFLGVTKDQFLDKFRCRFFNKEMPMYLGFYGSRDLLLITGPSIDYYVAVDMNYGEDIAGFAGSTMRFGLMLRFEVTNAERPFAVFDQQTSPRTPYVYYFTENPDELHIHFDCPLEYPYIEMLKFALRLKHIKP